VTQRWVKALDERWAIDLGLVVATAMAILTQQVVIWFHLIFVLLVVAALLLSFRMLVTRLIIWMLVSTGLVVWAVIQLDLPSDELSELPILTLVVAIVFLVARSRAQHHADLTESRRIINEQLAFERDGLRAQLEQSQRLDVLGRASAKMAHDLLNVFTIVKGCADELNASGSEDHQNAIAEVLEAVERGTNMLSEFLVTGQAHLGPPTIIDVGAVVQRAEPMLRYLIPTGIRLDIATPLDPVFVAIDRNELIQILMNLLTNAVDAIDQTGAISVFVDSSVSTRGADRTAARSATLAVRDSGRGFTGDDITAVFDPGYTTKRGTHSGLGLAMVSDIVSRAGGNVDLESRSTGTTVRIVLPLATESATRAAAVLIDDPHARALIEGELTALLYSIEDRDLPDDATADAPVDLVLIDDVSKVSDSITRYQRARVVDVAAVLHEVNGRFDRQTAGLLVRRLISNVPLKVDGSSDADQRPSDQ
jgi:signal transduction histidine kinase